MSTRRYSIGLVVLAALGLGSSAVAQGVSYRVDLVGQGWTARASDGEAVGTMHDRTPRSVRGIQISLDELPGDIRYRVRDVQNRWSDWRQNNETAASGGRQVNGLQVEVRGLSGVGVRYRVFSQAEGWTSWRSNNQTAEVRREAIQAVQIELTGDYRRYRDDQRLPPGRDRVTGARPDITYQVDVHGRGWSRPAREGEVAGAADRSTNPVLGLRIDVRSGAELEYRVRDLYGRWSPWTSSGRIASVNIAQIEAIQIQSRGSRDYDIRYRVYSRGSNWSPWRTHGQIAEVSREAVQAVQIEFTDRLLNRRVERIDPVDRGRDDRAGVRYQVDLVGKGWTSYGTDGQEVGSSRDRTAASVQAIRIESSTRDLQYRVIDMDGRWSNWASEGSEAKGRSQVRGVQIQSRNRTTSVRYRVYSRDGGWSSWRRDGETAEVTRREAVQAIQVEIVRR